MLDWMQIAGSAGYANVTGTNRREDPIQFHGSLYIFYILEYWWLICMNSY